ncbi:MAG: Ig-like domain-containing protein [Desulfococcaceae bacterium]
MKSLSKEFTRLGILWIFLAVAAALIQPLTLHAEGWVNRIGVPFGNPGMNGTVNAIIYDPVRNLLYAGGQFTTAGGVIVNHIAKWDGSGWSPLGTGIDGPVWELACDSSGNLYAGGGFTTAGGVSTNNIAKWNGSVWSNLGAGIDDVVYALVFDDIGNLYAGGRVYKNIVEGYVAKWNSVTSKWEMIGTTYGLNMLNGIYALAYDKSIQALYAGGDFFTINNISANNIAKWDGMTWNVLESGLDKPVMALAVSHDECLVAGGEFSSAGGETVHYLAFWELGYWNHKDMGFDGPVYALARGGNSQFLSVGGAFNTASQMSMNKIADNRFGFDWRPLKTGMNNTVYAVAYDSNGNLYAGGNFTTAGGKPSNHIAWYTFDTNPPIVGYNEDKVIPASAISQLKDGSGIITIKFKIKDPMLHTCSLNSFEYSPSGNASWTAPGDASGALIAGWKNNNGIGYSSSTDWGGTEYSFAFNTKHPDVAAKLDNIDQSDVQIRFKANDGVDDSDDFAVSDGFRLDNQAPSVGIVMVDNITNDATPNLRVLSTGSSEMWFALSKEDLINAPAYPNPWIPYTENYSGLNISTGGDGSKQIWVQFRDSLGNVQPNPSVVQTFYDFTAPNAPTVSSPVLTNDARPQWIWTSNGDRGDGSGTSSFYRYKLDDPMLENAAFTSYMTFFIPAANQSEGSHTLYVQERDMAGNWSVSGSKTVTIDITPPGTPTVSLTGTAVRNTQTATWIWANISSGGNGTFRYKLDDYNLSVGATETVLTTCTFSNLTDGVHTLYVQERDEAGNWSLYNSASVTVDTEAPNPPFVWNSTPLTNDPRPKWQWTPGGGGNGTFEYVLKKGAQTVLSETVKAVSFVPGTDLADGVYTLSVREQDIAGNVSEYDSSELEVDRTAGGAPVITEAVTPTKINPPAWKWRTNGGIGLFRYKLDPQNNDDPQMDTGAAETYADWFRPSGILPDGDHFLFVQERDTAGNWSPFSMGRIEVDTGKPCSCASSESFVLVAAGGIEVQYEFDEVYAGEPCINTDLETETSGSGIVKVELYVKKPGDSAFTLTAADAEGSIDGIFHYTVPGNAPGVYEFYTLAYDRAGNMENLSSACVTRTVFSTEFAGYGLIITGSVSDEEGLESHTKTGGRVWQHMKNRNFLVSDTEENHWKNPLDHVKFFSPYNDTPIAGKDDYSVNPENGLPCSYKEAVEHAITKWAPQRINEIEGPLWIVMLDHGSQDMFYLSGFEQIKPQQMNLWLETLESKLPADYFDKAENFIAVVMGACYSGSFIESLSDPGRIIISSAAADEVSYRGPRVPGLYRDGEFFVSALFNELGKGSDLHTSYTRAVELTENHTESGLTLIKAPYFDTARQHPWLDDDGNPGTGPAYWGSHTLRSGGDGDLCKLTDLGYGEETVPLEVTAAGKVKPVLEPSENSNLIWAKTNFAGDPKNIRVWVEIRKPNVILAETGTGEDTSRIVDMISGNLEWNASAGRYETTYTGFDLSGRYTLFVYAMGTDELISHPRRTYVYKSPENSPPGAVSLISPADGERVPLTFLVDWTDAADPDGDAVTYTVTVSRNADLSDPVTEKTGLTHSHAVICGSDGIADGKTYYWKVTATDRNGGSSQSSVRSFTADSTVNPADIIAEGNVYSTVTGLPIPGADILYGNAVLKCDASGGYAKVLPYQENYTVTVSAAGYSTEEFSITGISEGDRITENFGLYSLSNPGTGNIDGENGVTLADAVLVLKILAGTDTGDAVILKQSAVNGNSVIGPADAVFILQTVAEMRE